MEYCKLRLSEEGKEMFVRCINGYIAKNKIKVEKPTLERYLSVINGDNVCSPYSAKILADIICRVILSRSDIEERELAVVAYAMRSLFKELTYGDNELPVDDYVKCVRCLSKVWYLLHGYSDLFHLSTYGMGFTQSVIKVDSLLQDFKAEIETKYAEVEDYYLTKELVSLAVRTLDACDLCRDCSNTICISYSGGDSIDNYRVSFCNGSEYSFQTVIGCLPENGKFACKVVNLVDSVKPLIEGSKLNHDKDIKIYLHYGLVGRVFASKDNSHVWVL